jgi:hypothetical protein
MGGRGKVQPSFYLEKLPRKAQSFPGLGPIICFYYQPDTKPKPSLLKPIILVALLFCSVFSNFASLTDIEKLWAECTVLHVLVQIQ